MEKAIIFAAAVLSAVSIAACGNTSTDTIETVPAVTTEASDGSSASSDAVGISASDDDYTSEEKTSAAGNDTSAAAGQTSETDDDGTKGCNQRGTEDAVRYTYTLTSERVYDSAYTDDNSQLLIKSEYDLLSLAEAKDDSGNAGTINIILDEINRDTKEQTADFVSGNKDDAREQYQSQDGEYLGNYENDNYLTIGRADNRVLTVVRDNYTYLGGAHGYDATTAYSYDAQTGERLKLADVLTSTDDIAKILADRLLKDYTADRFDLGTDDLEGTIRKLLDGDEHYTGDNDTHYVTWYIGHEGINFVFDQYELASYAAGKFYVTLSKEDYPDLVDNYYADGPADYIMQLGLYDTTDVNGKDLTVDLNYDEYDTLNCAIVHYDGKSRSIDLSGDGISEYLVTSDDKNFLYLNVNFANDWQFLYIVDLASDDLTVTDFDNGVYDSILMDPDNMVLGTRTNVMSTVQIARSYKAGENGVPEPKDTMYKVTPQAAIWLTLKSDAVFNALDERDSDNTHKEEFTKGTRFRLWRTDNESIMDCVTKEGGYVRFHIDTGTWPQTIDGQYNLEELFEGTIFAG